MSGWSLLRDWDLTSRELLALVELAAELKLEKKSGERGERLAGKNFCLLFEKPSTRTRCSFEVAAHDQGAAITFLDSHTSHLGHLESVKDTARVLGRMYDGIGFRGSSQSDVETISEWAGVPVWNCMTNDWHPSQLIADLLTIRERSNKPFSKTSVSFVGDGRSNIANSLVAVGALLGMDIRVICPEQLPLRSDILNTARAIAEEHGATITVTTNIDQGVDGADFLYSDVWVWVNEPAEQWMQRFEYLKDFQITGETLNKTGNQDVKFLHCLPGIHGTESKLGLEFRKRTGRTAAEVSEEVFERFASVVFDQAENRMHAAKAIMVATLSERQWLGSLGGPHD